MTEEQARERVLDWLYRNEASRLIDRVRFQEYDQLWLAYFPVEPPELGGVRLIVDKEDGSIHSFPTNRPAGDTVREYLEGKGRR